MERDTQTYWYVRPDIVEISGERIMTDDEWASLSAQSRAAINTFAKKKDDDIWDLSVAKNGAYCERNTLLSALTRLYPASLELNPEREPGWDWILFIEMPTGQGTWHVHNADLDLFLHLPRNLGRVWDGHTTPQKYERVLALNT
jgi:hypothetical protein